MKTKLFIVMLLLAIAMPLWAFDFSADNDGKTIYYNVIPGTDKVEVTHKKQTGAYYEGKLTIPSTVSYSGKTYNVTKIGKEAFDHCGDLATINLPNSITSIEERAFAYCGVHGLFMPSSVVSIGKEAFEFCSHLKFVLFTNSSVTSIGERGFYHCESLVNITIPNGVTRIEEGTFAECTGLRDFTIPNGAVSIGKEAFKYCSGLSSITIPESVTIIGDEAFRTCGLCACSALTLSIPSSITSIGMGAFGDCVVKEITVQWRTPLKNVNFDTFCIGNSIKDVIGIAKLIVPKGTSALYKAADGWKYFGSIEEEK